MVEVRIVWVLSGEGGVDEDDGSGGIVSGQPWNRLSEHEKDRLATLKAEKRARLVMEAQIRLNMPKPPRTKRSCTQFSLRTHTLLLKAQRMSNALRVVTKPNGRHITLEKIRAECVEWYYARARKRLRAFARQKPSMRESVQMILDDS